MLSPRTSAHAAQTIFAVATGSTPSGVAVVRVSGANARQALESLLTPLGAKESSLPKTQIPPPRKLVLRSLVDPASKRLLDRAMVAWFPSPGSFTGEDVVELHVHGGRAVVHGILGALGKLPGLRLASRGEFTRRAFENAKIDLLQAEALADIVSADTEAQLQQALRQAGGEVSKRYGAWRYTMLGLLARTEACIDFGDDEEDVDCQHIVKQVCSDVESLRSDIKLVLQDKRGEAIRDGIKVAIIGPPNAGKSSLLNSLAGRDAAIVSDVPGTTRDIVEVRMNLGGVPVTISDTAGVRDIVVSQNDELGDAGAMAIEGLGIEKTKALAKEADFLLCVFDSQDAEKGLSRHLSAIEQIDEIIAERWYGQDHVSDGPDDVLVAMNKVDLLHDNANASGAESSASLLLRKSFPVGSQAPIANINPNLVHFASAACPSGSNRLLGEDDGVSNLCACLEDQIVKHLNLGGASAAEADCLESSLEATYVTRERHREHLLDCAEALSDALENLSGNDDQLELAVEDLRLAGESIGKIGGGVGLEDMLDRLFQEFCLGK